MQQQTLSFSQWMEELRQIAVQKYEYSPTVKFDEQGWRPYYDECCLSPEEALREDMSNA